MRFRFSSLVVITALAGTLLASFAVPAVQASAPKYLVAFQSEPSSGWTQRNFNPLIPSGALDFTRGAIYEPLMVITQAGGGKTYPWLATSYKWAKGNKSLTVYLRHGVKWSDGQAFTSADVVFTFNYGKQYNVDLTGLMTSGQISSVTASGDYAVVFKFSTVNTTVLQPLLSNVCIIPQHIWASHTDPLTFTNPNPVGTGPFTQVLQFQNSEYILGKNPYYWKSLKYDGLAVPAFSGNDSALASMLTGNVDWAPVSVTNAQTAWVAKAPQYNHYFYSPPTPPLSLMFNDSQYPYNLSAFRQALSMAINRKSLSVQAESGYEKPADALGIKFLYPSWVPKSVSKLNNQLSSFNSNGALSLLKKNHFKFSHGKLYDPHGNRVQMGITCPAGWNDWVSQLQILKQNFSKIGIAVTINPNADQNTWFNWRSSRTMGGKFYGLFGTESSGQTPYQYFWSIMSKESYFPINGNQPGGTWNIAGWYSSKATSLLKQFRATSNSKLQHSIVSQLASIWLNNMPVITTVTQANWYDWSTRHFTGFPTQKNYYAYGAAYTYPDDVKVLTSVTPVS